MNKEVKPVVQELEHANTYPAELIDTMKEIGVFGLSIPEPYGFGVVSMPCYVRVAEELARGWMSLAGAMGGHTVVAKLLVTFGTEEQKQHYLPRMATGELRATMALTEPGGGSDLQAIRTVARRDADHYVVNGSKTWISNARRSGLVALLCKTDPDARPAHRGVSILLVENPSPGFTISKDLPKLGYKGVEACELNFDDCRVPAAALLGGCATAYKSFYRETDHKLHPKPVPAQKVRVVKSASDLGVPFLAVGLFYKMGYMSQRLTADGEQLALDVGETVVVGVAAAVGLGRQICEVGTQRVVVVRAGERVGARDADGDLLGEAPVDRAAHRGATDLRTSGTSARPPSRGSPRWWR